MDSFCFLAKGTVAPKEQKNTFLESKKGIPEVWILAEGNVASVGVVHGQNKLLVSSLQENIFFYSTSIRRKKNDFDFKIFLHCLGPQKHHEVIVHAQLHICTVYILCYN